MQTRDLGLRSAEQHFCCPLHVAMQLGLYLQLNFNQVSYVLVLQMNAEKKVALRLVSEDPINDEQDKS